MDQMAFLSRKVFCVVQGIPDQLWTDSNTGWSQCIDINRLIEHSARFSSVQHAVDPNISFWLLRTAVNFPALHLGLSLPFHHLKRVIYMKLLKKLKDTNSYWSIVGKNYKVCAPNSSQEIDIRKQLMQYGERTQIDGSLIIKALDNLWGREEPIRKASVLLRKFTGRCAYLEVECSPIERPRLCAEV